MTRRCDTPGGAVVKTVGEGVLAAFEDPAAAVRAALDLLARPPLDSDPEGVMPRVGVHRGPVLAATLNDQLDYFGTTARQAMGTLHHARSGELVLTQPVAADPEVAALLNDRRLEPEVVPAERDGQARVIRVRLAMP